MAKQGMKHYYTRHEKKESPSVPGISGKAKHGHNKAPTLIVGEGSKVYHGTPHSEEAKIPEVFPAIDNDLAVENLTNDFDMTAADRQDLL